MHITSENDSVDVQLAVPSHARVGERVPITIVVRNRQARTIGLASVGPEITFDILVTRDDVLVWQRLHGQTIAMVLQIRMLHPGESFELRDVWHANVDAGRYDIVGRILTDTDPLETTAVSVEIGGPEALES